jgi:hypothetical protein
LPDLDEDVHGVLNYAEEGGEAILESGSGATTAHMEVSTLVLVREERGLLNRDLTDGRKQAGEFWTCGGRDTGVGEICGDPGVQMGAVSG